MKIHKLRFVKSIQSEIQQILVKNKILIVVRKSEIEFYAGNFLIHRIRFPNIASVQLGLDLYVGTEDGLFIVRDTFVCELLNQLKPIKTEMVIGNSVWSMASNGSILAVGGKDYIRLFRITENGLTFISKLGSSKIVSMCWHPYKPLLVCGSVESRVFVYNIDNLQLVHELKLHKTSEETIVWSCLVLQNGTIVTGDSLGTVQFWDGPTATLLKTIKAHFADVLTLIAEKNQVYSSGIDARVCMHENLDSTRTNNWLLTNVRKYHSHDVKALIIWKNQLWSGGVDTRISKIALDLKGKVDYFGHLPPTSIISVSPCKNQVLAHYDDCLKVFKLAELEKFDDIVTFDKQQLETEGYKQLLRINLKNSLLECSQINNQGTLIACSDQDKTMLFAWDGHNVSRVASKTLDSIRARVLKFMDDLLIIASFDGLIIAVDLMRDKIEFTLNEHEGKIIRHLEISPCNSYIVTADTLKRINVYDTTALKCYSLPKYPYLASSITFSKFEPVFAITTAHGDIYIWDIELQQLSQWSSNNSFRLPKMIQQQPLKGAFFPSSCQLIVYGDDFFCLIDLRTNSFKVDDRFEGLVQVLGIKDQMIVCERPRLALCADLPEAFIRKKYAT